MQDLNYLKVGSSWPSVMDLGYDQVVALMLDGQRYRALKEEWEGSPFDNNDWDAASDKLIKDQTK